MAREGNALIFDMYVADTPVEVSYSKNDKNNIVIHSILALDEGSERKRPLTKSLELFESISQIIKEETDEDTAKNLN